MNQPTVSLPDITKTACGLLPMSQREKSKPDNPQLTRLAGDGSQRCFYRFTVGHKSWIVIVPPAADVTGMEEAESAFNIGNHLFSCGVPVPQIHGFDKKSGVLLCDDCGNVLLHEAVTGKPQGPELKGLQKKLYTWAIRELVRMQITGAKKFDPSWCWQTECYDRQLMLERESGYFLKALCQELCRIDQIDEQAQQECMLIADRASAAPADYFLHRDFQSRNMMIKNDKIYIIDYQGGRLGPLAYDLASLLIDPYVGLSGLLREELVEIYLDELTSKIDYDRNQFYREYYLLSLQRNFQMLGAFAFLSQKQGKPFFRQFIPPALRELQTRLAKSEGGDYPALIDLTKYCLQYTKNDN